MDKYKNIELIISRYKENLSWVRLVPEDIAISIYDKSNSTDKLSTLLNTKSINHIKYKKLQNTGREGHTYLYHIYNNYQYLAEYNIFCQADPFDHSSKFLENIENIFNDDNSNIFKYGFTSLCNTVSEGPYANNDARHKLGLPIFYFLDLLFDIKMNPGDMYRTSYGAQFIVSKENIMNRPIEFYQLLLKIMSFDENPIEGFVLERLWPYILDKNLPLSNKILYFLK